MDSLGLTTCLTGTDTVGATNFDKAGAAAVIANVDGTSASVSAAIEAINSGTLAGQVPALGLINAAADAATAVETFQTANKAALDALATKLKATVGPDFDAELSAAESKADDARDLTVVVSTGTISADGTDTLVLKAQGEVFSKAEATQLSALTADQRALVSSYKSAISAEATAKAAKATDVQEASAVAGLGADATAATGLSELKASLGLTGTSNADLAQSLYNVYEAGVAGTGATFVGDAAALRASVETKLGTTDSFAAFKAVVVKDAAYADAIKATSAAKTKVTSTDVNGSTKATAYVKALADKTAFDEFLAKVTAADTDIAAVKAISDAYAVKTEAAEAAATAVTEFKADGVNIAALNGTDTAGTGSAVKDVFYFADKLTATSSTLDFKIGSFAAGDSIVLGSGYTFNSGALTTGDNNKAEFFLVKSDAGVQIVLEGANYGSSEVKADATTGVVASTSADHAQVITLTGVTADHVSVANGVVSYV